jgi:hypothetical protein
MVNLPKPFFKITYEDEFQEVCKFYKEPTTVSIETPVELFAEVMIAAGWQPSTIAKGFTEWADNFNYENDDKQLSFDFEKGND